MEKAYIILVHKNPDQLYRLISRLDDNTSTFFIHIDIKANINNFKAIEEYSSKIVFVKREDGRWGGFGIVQAVLNGLKAIQETKRNFNSIHLLSGQDYPIKSNAYINDFVANSRYSIFMTVCGALPVENWTNGGINRITEYFLGLEKQRKLVAKVLNVGKLLFPPLRKKIPYGLIIYGGSQWWTIDMYALNHILDYVEKHPKILKFFRHSLLPDEMFFQTVLLNSNDDKILDNMLKDNKRHIVFHPDKPNPITFTKGDLTNLLKSSALFARKFDTNVDSDILNLIDEACLSSYR